jgi:hypothetical protein
MPSRSDLDKLTPLKVFTDQDEVEQVRHLTQDAFLYEVGHTRYICSILGVLYAELSDRPDLRRLICEATWMARRMTDALGGNVQNTMFGTEEE